MLNVLPKQQKTSDASFAVSSMCLVVVRVREKVYYHLLSINIWYNAAVRRTMGKNTGLWKPEGKDCQSKESKSYRCGECEQEFRRPLVAKILSHGPACTYYACPHCLTEVPRTINQQSKRNRKTCTSEEATSVSATPEGNADCQHYFGYLKKRPKDTVIPDDCLTCEKMIECMAN